MGVKKEKPNFQISKNSLQLIFSLICMFLSFWILNSHLMSLVLVSSTNNFSIWATNVLFSISWIALFIGLIISFQGIYRRVIYGIIFFGFSIVTYLESISYFILGRYSHFRNLHFSISDILEATSQEFILTFCFSLLFFVLSCYLHKKVSIRKRGFYLLMIQGLVLLLLFISFRIGAYAVMGPRTIYTSGKDSNDIKTIYVKNEDAHKNLKISGLYDFTMRSIYKFLGDSFRSTLDYLGE